MGLLSTLKDSLKNDSAEFITVALKGYLKKDISSIYSFIDKDALIKLVFNDKNLKSYLSTLPNFLDFDSLDNYAITLKRFRFDYLLYNHNNDISFKIICYVESFAIDTNSKKSFDPLPENVNMMQDITSSAQEVLGTVIKDFLTSQSHLGAHEKVTAKNFIFNNYPENKGDQNVFALIQKEKGIKSNMFLIKSQEAINNNGYLYDDNDSKTNFQLKQVSWKELYVNNVHDRVPGKEFNADKTSLPTLIEKVTPRVIKVSDLDLNVDVSEKAVKSFLERKTKRQNMDEFRNKKLPDNIVSLMKKYGDVLANVGCSDIEKYKKFKAYSQLIE